MYSVVLLAAVTTGEAAPQHGFKHGYRWGACYGACYGVCYTGYVGELHVAGGWGLPYGGYYAGFGAGCLDGVTHGALPLIHTPPTGYAPIEAKPETESKPAGKDDKKKKPEDENQQVKARASVTIELPRGAALYVDDVAIAGADERRHFRTPELTRGEEYYYEVRAELVHDGQTLTQKKRVSLTAGDSVKIDFSTLGVTTGVAAR